MAGSRERLDGDDDRPLREISNELRAIARAKEQVLGGEETGHSKTRGRLHVSLETAPDVIGDRISVPNTIPEDWGHEGLIYEVEVRVKKLIKDND